MYRTDKYLEYRSIIWPVGPNGWVSVYELIGSGFKSSCSQNELFGLLLDISPKYFIFSKTFSSEFLYVEIWFTDQNSKPLKIEDKINITLAII